MNLPNNLDTIFAKQLAESLGLYRYQEIQDKVQKVNVAKDKNFQKTFNGFYVVRRNQAWRKEYYSFFENNKKENLAFKDILTHLYAKTGQIECSFSSKMLATINPDNPIWDQYVLKKLGMKLDGRTKKEKIENAIVLYTEIQKWYQSFLREEQGKEWIREFDKALPQFQCISDVKKIDTILWSIR